MGGNIRIDQHFLVGDSDLLGIYCECCLYSFLLTGTPAALSNSLLGNLICLRWNKKLVSKVKKKGGEVGSCCIFILEKCCGGEWMSSSRYDGTKDAGSSNHAVMLLWACSTGHQNAKTPLIEAEGWHLQGMLGAGSVEECVSSSWSTGPKWEIAEENHRNGDLAASVRPKEAGKQHDCSQ